MASGYYGTVDVTIGLSNGGNGAPEQTSIPHQRRQLSRDEQRTLALRLRRRGWSYRRISTRLELSYQIVCRWLDDGPPPRASAYILAPRQPARLTVSQASHAVTHTEHAPEFGELTAKTRQLAKRVEDLAAQHAELETRVVRLDQRLEQAVKNLYESLLERLTAMFQPKGD